MENIQTLIDGIQSPEHVGDRMKFMEALIKHLFGKPDPRVVIALLDSMSDEAISNLSDALKDEITERDGRVGEIMLRVFRTGPKELQQRVADRLKEGPISDAELDALEALPELDPDYLDHLEAEAERHFATDGVN
jgi:hypothetical protein